MICVRFNVTAACNSIPCIIQLSVAVVQSLGPVTMLAYKAASAVLLNVVPPSLLLRFAITPAIDMVQQLL